MTNHFKYLDKEKAKEQDSSYQQYKAERTLYVGLTAKQLAERVSKETAAESAVEYFRTTSSYYMNGLDQSFWDMWSEGLAISKL